jgi:hypothetical protein
LHKIEFKRRILMKRHVILVGILFLVMMFFIEAAAGDKFRLIVFNDTYEARGRYKLNVILNPFSCPGGAGSPWIGATLKTRNNKVINLPGKSAKSSGKYEWRFDLPAGVSIGSCRFTVALWCGTTCLDRVPGPVTGDPKKINMRLIEIGKDLARF